jgi:hypothetical protein
MDDYKSLQGVGVEVKKITSALPEKGHVEELNRLHESLKGNTRSWPIELWDMVQTTEITLLLNNQPI